MIAVESGRDVPVRFVNGHLSERGSIRGHTRHAELTRIVGVDNREASRLDDDGLVMTDRLAEKLNLRVGDRVLVEVLEGRQRTVSVPLSATAREMMGLNAYMERRALNRLLQEGDDATWFRGLGRARPRDGAARGDASSCRASSACSARPRCCATCRRSARATCAS